MQMNQILKAMAKTDPEITASDVRAFAAHYALKSDADVAAELSRARKLSKAGGVRGRGKTVVPPAGLKARQAIPIVLTYVREERAKPVSLTRAERASFAAMTKALDRKFGAGFAAQVVDELNAMPNGSLSLHYRR